MFKNIVIKILNFLIILVFLLTLTSCKNDLTKYIDNSVAIVYKNNVPYIINEKGELFDLSQYDTIVPIFDNILIVKKDGLFGYIKNTGEPLTEIIYDEAYPFSEGKAVVRIQDLYHIIDINTTILYTFETGVISYSYFSENKLVISKNEKQGYLKYDPNTKLFSYLIEIPKEGSTLVDTNIIYDYCGDFKGNYAVIGNLNDEGKLKYTHIKEDGSKLYENLEWDYAHNFSEGYAVVGNTMTYNVKVYCGNENWFDDRASTNIEIMGYMYVDTEGNYIGEKTYDLESGKEIINPYVYAMAKDYKDSVALVARLFFYVEAEKRNHLYDYSTDRFFYNYDFIDYNGKPIYGYYGYEIAGSYNNWSGNISMYNDFFKLDDYYIATFFRTNWHIYYTPTNDLNPAFPFKTAKYDISNQKNDEILDKFPWVEQYLKDFTIGDNTPGYVANMVTLPYTLSSFKTSSYFNNKLVAKAQTYSGMKDSCGLLTINIVDGVPLASYIIPPLYEEIIY